MRYKKGDLVRIKTWDQLEKEFGVTKLGNIKCNDGFILIMEEEINKNFSDRILKIAGINEHSYRMFNIGWSWKWSDDMIECLESEIIDTNDKIKNRFQILDIR